ncbi:MAG: N-acetyltransferase [Culturomica sp.]|jgi:predicted GNAT family acetyltransferase|nr:N-acetyltransferase [Culturomica sp.]
MENYQITHHPDRHRFETEVDGFIGYVTYELDGDKLYLTHTIVDRPIEGRGVGNALVKSCFEYAKQHHLKVVPVCAYSEVWVKRHPEYESMVARLY